MAGLMSGIFILLLGLFRLGRIVALIPAPVITGFTSGIAVLIAFGQIDNALGLTGTPAESVLDKLRLYSAQGIHPDADALLVTVLVVGIMLLWPRIKVLARIPGSLAAILIASAVVGIFDLNVSFIGEIPRSLLLEQRLQLGALPWAEIPNLLLPALTIAALGSIESLLCGAVAGNMTGIRMHNSVELVAQGIGNMLIPFFGGVPATAAIARTSVNVKSGGVTRMASIVHGFALLSAVLLLAPAMQRIPLAGLAGVLLVTAWRMNEWHAIHFYFSRRLKHAMLAFAITLAATLLLDLTQAILVGFGISSLIFMAQMSDLYVARQPLEREKLSQTQQEGLPAGKTISVYYLAGPLFFAAARRLLDEVEAQDEAKATIILSMRGVPLVDATGIEVLRELWQRQHAGGGDMLLAGLQPRVESLLQRTGMLGQLGSDRVFWSTDRAITALGQPVPSAAPEELLPPSGLDAGLMLTPHEDRFDEGV
jgi:SulP family sulfate permease